MPVMTMDKNHHNNYVLLYKYFLFILFFPGLWRTANNNWFSFTWVTTGKACRCCLLLSVQLTAHFRLPSSRLSPRLPGTTLLWPTGAAVSPAPGLPLCWSISSLSVSPDPFTWHLGFTYFFICLLLFIIIDSGSSSLSSFEWNIYSFISINSADQGDRRLTKGITLFKKRLKPSQQWRQRNRSLQNEGS